VGKDFSEVSETAANHPLDLRRAVDLYVHPLKIFRRYYLDEVMVAGAMLSSLEYLCDQGHIDTRILTKLSGQKELLAIGPRSTVVNSVKWEPLHHHPIFKF